MKATFLTRSTVGFAAAGLIALTPAAVLADSKEYKFTNDTGKDATDLHIKTNHGVTWTGTVPGQDPAGSFKEASGKGSSKIGLAAGVTGTGVKDGDSIVITFEYDGTTPEIKETKWTFDNKTCLSASSNYKDALCLEALAMFDGGPAAGNGMLMVVIDAQPHPFQTQPGDPPFVTAQKFAQLVAKIPYGHVLDVGPNHVRFTGDSYFTQHPNVMVEMVQPDFQQLINVQPLKSLSCPADLDGDGKVGQSDLGILLANFGTSCGDPSFSLAADIDDDGTVGQSDLGILLANYETSCQ